MDRETVSLASGGVTQAVVLVGGAGTRLGDLTAARPKPLVDVAGSPFLDWLLFEIARHGIRDIVLLAGFAASEIETYAASTPLKERFGLCLRVLVETTPAGTGGALRRARETLADRFLLLNGDSLFNINLAAFAETDVPTRGAVMAVRAMPDASRSGVVELAGDRVQRFLARPATKGPGLANAGVYVVDRAVIDDVAETCSLEADVLPLLASDNRLAARAFSGFFLDIGVPEALRDAQHALPRWQRRGAIMFAGNVLWDRARVWRAGAVEAVRIVNDAGLFAFAISNDSDGRPVALRRGAHLDAVTGIEAILRAWPIERALSHIIGGDKPERIATTVPGFAMHQAPPGRLDDFVKPLVERGA